MRVLASHHHLHPAVLLTTLLFAAELVMGCGGATPCSYTKVATVSPAVATADHSAVAPGDQQQFSAFSQELPTSNSSGCAVPTAVPTSIAKLTPTWTVSDSTNVKISSTQDATNGLATCIGTTRSPVTVTALGSLIPGGANQTLGTAILTCK